GEPEVEAARAGRYEPEPGFSRPYVDTVDAHDAARRRHERRGDAKQGRLPGAVRPDESVDLARRDREVDVAQDVSLAEATPDAGDLDRTRDGHALYAHRADPRPELVEWLVPGSRQVRNSNGAGRALSGAGRA